MPINVFTAVLHDGVVRNRNGCGPEPTAVGEHAIGAIYARRHLTGDGLAARLIRTVTDTAIPPWV
jgi:hypothetical protein